MATIGQHEAAITVALLIPRLAIITAQEVSVHRVAVYKDNLITYIMKHEGYTD